MRISKIKKGFTTIELTLSISLLLALTIGTIGSVGAYTNYRDAASGGQKLRTARQLIRLGTANRLGKDAAYVQNGATGDTVIELIQRGDIVDFNREYEGAESVMALIITNLMEKGEIPVSDTDAQLLLSKIGNEALDKSELDTSTAKEGLPGITTLNLEIVNGIPNYKNGTNSYDPSGSTTDGLWDSGPIYVP